MSPMASHTGRRADDRRKAEPRRSTEVRRGAQEYERELRRHELAVGRSLTGVLPTDRPARMRELIEARRVLSGGIRDLQRLARDLEADLARYNALRSRSQREVLAYEAVAGEIEEVLLRWQARHEQLNTTIERGNRRQSRGEGRPGERGRPSGGQGGQGRAGGRGDRAQGDRTSGERTPGGRPPGERSAGRGRTAGAQGRANGRQPGGRRGRPAGRSGAGGGRSDPPRSGGGGKPNPPRSA